RHAGGYRGRARPPSARIHLQGRPPAEGSRRGVPPVSRSPPGRRGRPQRAGRHLLSAGGIAAHAVIWSVSVDLDGLGCYAAIHGLSPSLDERAQRAVPEVALQRFGELFQVLDLRATFSAFGREAAITPASLQ